MRSKILETMITVVHNQAVAMVLCFLMGIGVLSNALKGRLWTSFATNMTMVFAENFTEVTIPSIIACLALASRRPPANLACLKSSRCVFASVYLPRIGGEQTEGFTCWYSQVCIYEGVLLREKETVPEPSCPEFQNLQCTKYGMILQAAPPSRTTCTAPFEQLPFGSMFDSNFTGTYCEASQHCQELGADLASPETEQDTADMKAYYDIKHDQQKSRRFVGLFKADGVWRWPANQREAAPTGTGEWAPGEPNGVVNVAVMFPYPNDFGEYVLGDGLEGTTGKPICHVWPAE